MPINDRDRRQRKEQRPQGNQRLVHRRHRDGRLLAAQLLRRPLPSLKFALDVRLPLTELGADQGERKEGRRAKQISPKPG
jgi:hypothetical protein